MAPDSCREPCPSQEEVGSCNTQECPEVVSPTTRPSTPSLHLKGPSTEEVFAQLNLDRDGYLSGDEWDDYMDNKSATALFVGLFDADDNGCLDAIEFSLMMLLKSLTQLTRCIDQK
jgi:hypothetical protein